MVIYSWFTQLENAGSVPIDNPKSKQFPKKKINPSPIPRIRVGSTGSTKFRPVWWGPWSSRLWSSRHPSPFLPARSWPPPRRPAEKIPSVKKGNDGNQLNRGPFLKGDVPLTALNYGRVYNVIYIWCPPRTYPFCTFTGISIYGVLYRREGSIYIYINIHTQNYTNGCIKDYTEKGCQNQYPGNIWFQACHNRVKPTFLPGWILVPFLHRRDHPVFPSGNLT